MANDYVEVENLRTPEFRVGMNYAFQKYVSKENAAKGKKADDPELKYLLRCLFPHPDSMTPEYKKEYDTWLAKLKKQALDACVRKWGADQKKWPNGLRTPFRDQGEKDFEGWVPGALWFQPSNKNKPQVVDGQHNNADIVDASQFYAGCYAKAIIHCYAYDFAGNAGIGIDLGNIQKTRDGEPLSGRLKAQDEFEPVAGASVDFDVPAANASDDLAKLFG